MGFFKKNKFIILLLSITFLLRLPSLFEPYWYGDEGIYLTAGMAIRKGFLLYRDIFDNKPPLIYLLSAIANGKLFWLRLILSLWVLTSIYFFYRLSLLLTENNKKISQVSTLVFTFLTTIRLLEGNIANAELFILLPTILGFYLFFLVSLKSKSKNNIEILRPLLIGTIFSLGFLFKIPALFDFLTLMIFLTFFRNEEKPITFGKTEILLLSGFFLPILITAAFFWIKGAFGIFFSATFLQTLGYLSSWKTGSHTFSWQNIFKSELFLKALFVLLITLLLWFKRKAVGRLLIFVNLWFIFSLFAATLSGRPYSHYLIQIVPSLSIIIGLILTKKTKFVLYSGLTTISLLLLSFCRYRFWVYPTFSYYRNFLEYSFGKKDKNAYFSYFSWQTPRNYKIAGIVLAYSKPNERMFIWADEPVLYPLTRILPATPFTTAYHTIDLKQYSKVEESINTNHPEIIIFKEYTGEFSWLEQLIKNQYLLIDHLDEFKIYRSAQQK